jgi:hypothetical protein
MAGFFVRHLLFKPFKYFIRVHIIGILQRSVFKQQEVKDDFILHRYAPANFLCQIQPNRDLKATQTAR